MSPSGGRAIAAAEEKSFGTTLSTGRNIVHSEFRPDLSERTRERSQPSLERFGVSPTQKRILFRCAVESPWG